MWEYTQHDLQCLSQAKALRVTFATKWYICGAVAEVLRSPNHVRKVTGSDPPRGHR